MRGTLFPELDLPFRDFQNKRPLPKTPLTEIMTLDFVCVELRLYLDTHPDDAAAAELLREYEAKSKEAKSALEAANSIENSWVFSPWPWEGEL